jgi:hypothetical protein
MQPAVPIIEVARAGNGMVLGKRGGTGYYIPLYTMDLKYGYRT